MADAEYRHLTMEAIHAEIKDRLDFLLSRASGQDRKTEKYDAYMKEHAKSGPRIVEALYKSRRSATAAELERSLGIKKSTLYNALTMLTFEGWIREIDGNPTRWVF